MKIKVIAADAASCETIRRVALGIEGAADLSCASGNPEQLETLINGSAPDLLLLDGAPGRTLEAIELLNQKRGGLDTIVLSGDTSPEFFLRAMRAGVREVVPASGSAALLPEAIRRALRKREGTGRPPGGKVLAFVPCKGGSGATFLATNLAYALAAECGRRVALIDLNLQFGDAMLFLSEQKPKSHLAEVAQQIHRLDASLLASSMLEVLPGLSILAAPESPEHASDVKREHVEAIVKLARGNYDVVILDVGQSLDAVNLQALDMADTILPVLQLTVPFIRGARRLLQAFRSLDYPDSKVCPLVNRHGKGGEISLKDLEQAIGSRVFRTIPNSYAAVAHAINLGEAIVKNEPGNPVSKALLELGQALVPAAEPASAGGWLARVFGRR